MKKILSILSLALGFIAMVGCGNREPGRSYMPDMVYSRAYETYSNNTERLALVGAHYNALPVAGTMARGAKEPYKLHNDSVGYIQAASIKSPLNASEVNMTEAERLYLINCGICHGSKLDGNGPLFNGGDGPYSAAPRNFMNPDSKAMTDGTMFHSITYGIRQMGSYASQLTPEQRWMVITYIRKKQFPDGGFVPPVIVKDTTKAK